MSRIIASPSDPYAAPPPYRGRFAPSPTGPLHFGSLVTAVGSFLEARTRGGAWLLRMEDLDRPREQPRARDAILRTLEACGLTWDGPVAAQSRRTEAYHAALHRLAHAGAAFPCACSRREIADSAVAGIEGPVYPGTCRGGLPHGRRPRAIRVLTAGAEPVVFADALQGEVRQDVAAEAGDFIIYRADRIVAYQLAVVVDDALQGITDVVRGADLLHSTPRQILLQRLLGLPTPRYVHLPVAVNAAGEKLSKQTRASAVDVAHPVPALVAAMRFLGHPPPGLEAASVATFWQWALENWRLERVPRAAAIRVDASGR
ncbi:MAG: tRNA glutamyl-Q(34) synthetase GluQRS [Pseudomonadota bacterium]